MIFLKILLFFLEEFFPYFQTKILNYIFMTIFIFYEVLKRAVCFCSILVQLLINFDKEIRRQLHFLLIQVHLFKNTGNFFFYLKVMLSLFALKMSAVPLNCSLYEILQSPCGSRREEVDISAIWIAANCQNAGMDTSTYRTELFSSLIFTTAQVVFITAKIAFIFTSLSAVQIYDFPIFTVATSE